MGIKLIVEILDHAPPDLSLAERLVLIVIAEEANDGTRKGWPPLDVIADRAGLGYRGAEKAIRRLRQRGYELRVPLKVGKDGRPVYSWRGQAVTYQIPAFPRRDGPGARRRDDRAAPASERPAAGGDLSVGKARRSGEKGPPLRYERPAAGGGPSPHLSSEVSSSSARVAVDGSAGGHDEDGGHQDEDGRTADAAAGKPCQRCDGEDLPPGTWCKECGRINHGSTPDDHASAEIQRRLGMVDEWGSKVLAEIRARASKPISKPVGYVAQMSDADLYRYACQAFECQDCMIRGRQTRGGVVDLDELLCADCVTKSNQHAAAARPQCRECGRPFAGELLDVPHDRICSTCRDTEEQP